MDGVGIQNQLAVDFVGADNQVMSDGDFGQGFELVTAKHPPNRVVRIAQHQ